MTGRRIMSDKRSGLAGGHLAGVLLSPLRLLCTAMLGGVLLLVLAWCVQVTMVRWVWPAGAEHLRQLLAIELAQGHALAALQGGSTGSIIGPANLLYFVVFEATGIHAMSLRFADARPLSIPDTVLRTAFLGHQELMETLMVATQLVGVRMAILVCYGPLLVLACGLGAADGLVQRAIRKSCGGRESASLYHRAKHSQMVVLGLGAAALVLWPVVVEWRLYPVGLVALAAIGARTQWSNYKKYL